LVWWTFTKDYTQHLQKNPTQIKVESYTNPTQNQQNPNKVQLMSTPNKQIIFIVKLLQDVSLKYTIIN
jgi:hypothetical protein